ncbi:hypothetical protein [Rhodopila sp.]|uniref:hypothetical protein n=1 Tax=Rhodopila sp. TaxID=2480087 RepID=UPI003D0E561E
MSRLTVFPASIAATVLDTVLGGLAYLFLIGAPGDPAIARHAATRMLAAHHPHTDDELRLAAKIISFSFQALEALSEATAADLSLTAKLRQRASAVSLSRESHKAQRQLDKLQRARRTQVKDTTTEAAATQTKITTQDPATETTAQLATSETTAQADHAQMEFAASPADPTSASASRPIDQSTAAIETTPDATKTQTRRIPWTQGYHKRLAAQHITEQLKKNAAAHAARSAQQNGTVEPTAGASATA